MRHRQAQRRFAHAQGSGAFRSHAAERDNEGILYYTQWEFFFARHFKRRLSIYIAEDDYQPDLPAPTGGDPELQRASCDHIIKEQGLDRSYFANEHLPAQTDF